MYYYKLLNINQIAARHSGDKMFESLFENYEKSGRNQAASSNENIFVVSIGGSVLLNEGINSETISKFAASISSLHREGFKFALVVGGGEICREYVLCAEELGANNFFLDELAIKITRANASLLIAALKEEAYPEVLADIGVARGIIDSGKIVVYGGIIPGATTDFVAALLAESLGAKFINLSNVDGIYTSDPKKNKRAKMYPAIDYDKLMGVIASAESKPGQNLVIDLPACNILRRSRIKALFLNGQNLENFESAVRGQSFTGTIVSEEPSAELEQ